MWFLPSRGRPHLMSRVFSVASPTEPGVLAIDQDQRDDYAAVKLPKGWLVLVLPRMVLAAKLNAMFECFPNCPYYGILNDDMVPQTPGWDSILAKAAGLRCIAWGDDCLNGRIGAAAFGGELIRKLGWLACPAVKHFYIDDVHELIAADLGIGKRLAEVKIPHLHFSAKDTTLGVTPYDTTYLERPSATEDQMAYRAWCEREWPALRQRLVESVAA